MASNPPQANLWLRLLTAPKLVGAPALKTLPLILPAGLLECALSSPGLAETKPRAEYLADVFRLFLHPPASHQCVRLSLARAGARFPARAANAAVQLLPIR